MTNFRFHPVPSDELSCLPSPTKRGKEKIAQLLLFITRNALDNISSITLIKRSITCTFKTILNLPDGCGITTCIAKTFTSINPTGGPIKNNFTLTSGFLASMDCRRWEIINYNPLDLNVIPMQDLL